MTTNFGSPDSLAELSALVERTLIETGRLFRKSNSLPASTQLQRSIPTYYDGFQDALDSLSEQIFIAKAFLEKDYEAIKAREVVPQPTEDVSMSGVDQKTETSPLPLLSTLEQTDLASQPLKVEPTSDENAAAGISAPTEAIPPPQPNEPALKIEEKETGGVAPMDQTLPGGTEGIQFDTVLDEGGAPNSFDLNYDFGNDDMGNQAFLSGTAFGSTTTGPDKQPGASLPPADNATAIPAGGGAFDMELGKADGANPFPDSGTGMDDMMAPGESSFDDLFMESENFGEAAGGPASAGG
ncbi:uncharacterized protein N7473_010521 [Penicillium subrubescens]|uniref:uncharacterized protein n=1 Tax=Penicillium subrubescens TaxID=1316194 RepID=UPI0025452CB0|nr:uncharacterized protein N7473_010521 [Penicillium subrubescens]KAJ5883635.1 hypothetical protein N7473_010521 [Penicillium subrubescens]